jgi:hypothetical protein
MHDQGFWIKEEKGNNAFSYEKRGRNPRLFVAPVISGDFSDLQIGREVVFEDFEDGKLKSCVGLRNFVEMEVLGTPAVIFDNHNHAFYFWKEKGFEGATLVHVDQHKDTREPSEWYKGATLEEVFKYTNEILNVGNYVLPAVKCGLVGEVISITGNIGLDQEVRQGNVILNLDLDFFVSEMEIDFEKAREFLRKQAKMADFITIATSPFFIDQERALEVLRLIFAD